MKIGVIVAALVGLALFVWLLFHIGIEAVWEAVAKVGFGGFAFLVAAGIAVVGLLGSAWLALIPHKSPRDLVTYIIGRQTRDSAGDILPFSQLGGIVIGARAVILRGVSPPLAFASTITDVTTELMAQIVFILIGIGLAITQLRTSATTAPYVDGLILGTLLLVPGIAAFVILQQRGSALAERLAGRFLPAALKHTAAFSEQMRAMYDSPARLALSSTIHLLSWIAAAGLIWLSVRLIGYHLDFFSCIAIEALLAALRSATVFVPAAIGVQEAGYAALMPLFGLGPEVGLAVSLLKRARDLVIGVPVLLAWQFFEGRRALTADAA
ncbi:MAG: flippase-like domain-containing protein [Alphaproteobacteria bacterium]|nr:flippase-like domain-containing protein [Alphaproteobacteria bacterium]MBL6938441.1 flippase-like domain-containing protein [Alphaproteobacteria bacterium]MBL7096500.1 flippase-like domain-containing protein [Alphaproteobacteria bacterium]